MPPTVKAAWSLPESSSQMMGSVRYVAGFPWDGTTMYHLRGVSDHTVGISVDTRSVAPRAVAALRAHRSQWSTTLMEVTDDWITRSLRTEDWVIAWPPAVDQAPVLTDILEGLD